MLRYNIRKSKDLIFLFMVAILTLIVIIPLFHIIYTVFINGMPTIMDAGLAFFTSTLSHGGIGPAIAGTFILTFLSSLIGIPVAFLIGVYAYEYPESLIGKATKTLLQIMLEFPTILVGIFVMNIIAIPMGSYSAFAGAFALAIILIPYVAVYTHEAMRQIPFTYREASFSLGLNKMKAVFRILVPLSKRGILTGMLIGVAKVAGETAPLLFTAGGLYQSYPEGIIQPVGAIPLLIYTLVQSPSEADHAMAWGASLVLLAIFLAVCIPIRKSLKEVEL